MDRNKSRNCRKNRRILFSQSGSSSGTNYCIEPYWPNLPPPGNFDFTPGSSSGSGSGGDGSGSGGSGTGPNYIRIDVPIAICLTQISNSSSGLNYKLETKYLPLYIDAEASFADYDDAYCVINEQDCCETGSGGSGSGGSGSGGSGSGGDCFIQPGFVWEWTTPDNFTWTAPCNGAYKIEAIGGGGCGEHGYMGHAGRGGGAGAYMQYGQNGAVFITQGTELYIQVGLGGGVDISYGGASYVHLPGQWYVLACGGAGGAVNGQPGYPGWMINCSQWLNLSGTNMSSMVAQTGKGAPPVGSSGGGGGGLGGDAVGTNGGPPLPPIGGAGGNGGPGPGSPGLFPGGGGGGGGEDGGTGAPGADGMVRITYLGPS